METFLFDFEVFEGNSGGPVYFHESNRYFGGSTHLGQTIVLLMGLVTSQQQFTQEIVEPFGRREQKYPLALANVVHASLIKETIELLPNPETAKP